MPHTPVRVPASKSAQNNHSRILQGEFRHIQELTGKQFTWDAAVNNEGTNALCTEYSTPATPFQEADVAGQHVWINPPPDQAESFLQRFFKCWQKAPTTTSGCIMLPQHLTHIITDRAEHVRRLEHYRHGSKLFESPDVNGRFKPCGKSPFSYTVFYIPSLSEDQPAGLPGISIDDEMLEEPSSSPLAFCFSASVSDPGKNRARHKTVEAKLMMDSGATTRCASERWVKKHGFQINKTHANWSVKVANSDTVFVSGTVDLEDPTDLPLPTKLPMGLK